MVRLSGGIGRQDRYLAANSIFGIRTLFFVFVIISPKLFPDMAQHRPSMTGASGAAQALVKDHSADEGGPVRQPEEVHVHVLCRRLSSRSDGGIKKSLLFNRTREQFSFRTSEDYPASSRQHSPH